jgi:hypothetical protein
MAFFGNVAMVSSDNIYKLHVHGSDSIDAFNEQRINYFWWKEATKTVTWWRGLEKQFV